MNSKASMISMPIAAGLALILTCLIGPVRAAEPKRGYCPETDFVELCLAGLDTLPAIEDLGKQRGWRFRHFTDPLLQDGMQADKGNLGHFTIKETRFSDTIILECAFDLGIAISRNPKKPTDCDGTFPLITSKVPQNTRYESSARYDAAQGHSWLYEHGKKRVSIDVFHRSGKYGSTGFSVQTILTRTATGRP